MCFAVANMMRSLKIAKQGGCAKKSVSIVKYKNAMVLNRIFFLKKFSEAREKCLKNYYNDPMTKVYLAFYRAALPVFTTFNKPLQPEVPLIHYLHSEKKNVLSRLRTEFIQIHMSSRN